MGTIIAFPFKELRRRGLERLRDALLRASKAIKDVPLHADGPHPGYIELGRILHEASMRMFKPREIPRALRYTPWLFVLAELAREFPDHHFAEQSMAEFVQLYLLSLADRKPPTPETLPLDFAPARKRVCNV